MVRALWTAASGMIGQQTNVDTIANNLANVNTTAYKTEVNEFKSLLYQTIQSKTTSANGEQDSVSGTRRSYRSLTRAHCSIPNRIRRLRSTARASLRSGAKTEKHIIPETVILYSH